MTPTDRKGCAVNHFAVNNGVFRTDGVSRRDRVGAWEDYLSTAFVPFRVATPVPDDFNGEMRTTFFGMLEASDIRSGRQEVRRGRKLIDEMDTHYIKLGVQVAGSCVVSQIGREALLAPSDLALYDCARPVQLSFDGPFRQLVFMFPRSLLRLSPIILDRAIATTISGREGLGALVHPLLTTLIERSDELPASASQHIADSVLDLLTAMCVERASGHPEDDDPLRRSLMLQIKAFIEARLGDPELAPDVIAGAHHISTRYLHRLFENEGISVGRYLRARRLEQARRDLIDATQSDVRVAVIAARWGYPDPAHFSASFRVAFGLSPREQRLVALAENRDVPPAGGAAPGSPGNPATTGGRVEPGRQPASPPRPALGH